MTRARSLLFLFFYLSLFLSATALLGRRLPAIGVGRPWQPAVWTRPLLLATADSLGSIMPPHCDFGTPMQLEDHSHPESAAVPVNGHLLPLPSDGPGVIHKLLKARDTNDMTTALNTVKDMAQSNSTLTDALLPLLAELTNRIPSSGLADWTSCMGKMGCRGSNNAHSHLLQAVLSRLVGLQSLSSVGQLVLLLEALVRIDIKRHRLPKGLDKLLLKMPPGDCEAVQLSSMLTSLSRMGFLNEHMPSPFISQIWTRIVALKGCSISLSSFILHALGQLGFYVDRMNGDQVAAVIHLTRTAMAPAPQEDAESIGKLNALAIHGIGKMRLRPSLDLLKLIEQRLLSSVGLMKDKSLPSLMMGMGMINWSWRQFTPAMKEALHSAILQAISSSSAEQVAGYFAPLEACKIRWSDLSRNLTDSLTAHIPDIMTQCDPQTVTNALTSIGKMEVSWPSLPEPVQQAIHQALPIMVNTTQADHVIRYLYALDRLGFRFNGFPQRITTALAACLKRIGPSMTQKQLQQLFSGLSSLGAKWRSMPPSLQLAMSDLMGRLVLTDALFYTMGKFGVPWESENVSNNLRSDLENKLMGLHSLENQALYYVIFGLGMMDVNWYKTLNDKTQRKLAGFIHSPAAYTANKPGYLSGMLVGMGKMGIKWNAFEPVELEKAFLRVLPFCEQYDLTYCLHGIACMDARWDDLQLPTLRQLVVAFEQMHVSIKSNLLAMCMQALAVMSFDLDYNKYSEDPKSLSADERERFSLLWRMHQAALNSFQRTPTSAHTLDENLQFAIYFKFLNFLPGGKALLSKLGSKTRLSLPHTVEQSQFRLIMGNSLQKGLEALAGGAYKVVHQFAGFGEMMRMDFAVTRDDKVVAFVDIDGTPTLNKADYYDRRDALKEFFYAQRYPGAPVYRLTIKSAAVHGRDIMGEALAYKIVNLAASQTNT